MTKFDWKAAVGDVLSVFSQKSIAQADAAAQRNITYAFLAGIVLILLFFTFKRGH